MSAKTAVHGGPSPVPLTDGNFQLIINIHRANDGGCIGDIMLKSQEMRKLAPEMDPLRLGMGWSLEDLGKPQIILESTYGDSHPGSAHLDTLVREAEAAITAQGGKAARRQNITRRIFVTGRRRGMTG